MSTSLAGIRPPWLKTPADIEEILETQDSSFQFTPALLRSSRDECPIVDQILSILLQQSNLQQILSEWELRFAKSRLAVDVQEIFIRWAEEGLQKTMERSMIGSLVDNNRKRRIVDLRTGSSLKRGSPDSIEDEDEDEGPDPKQMRMQGHDKDFRCPYYLRDRHDSAHKECKTRVFPNPRKLKEHIWRFTKPFKCPTCGEGFGREKTKAIHCEQRKVKCIPKMSNIYDGSYEQQRDRDIELARNTTEMLVIFDKYDQQKKDLASGNAEMVYRGPASSSMAASPQSPHDGQQRAPWVSPDTPTNPWAQTQLHVQTYPSTPAQTPPYNQTQLQSPHSPVNFNPQYSPINFTRQSRGQLVPKIIINDNMTGNHLDDVMSAHSATSYHSQPTSPMMRSFSSQHTGGSMYHDVQTQQQKPQENSSGQQTSPDVHISNGYGAFGPFEFRFRHHSQ